MNRFGIAIDSKMQTFTALGLVVIMSMTMMALACPPPAIQSVLANLTADLPVLEQQSQNIIKLVDPEDLALAQKVSGIVNGSLQAVSDALAAYEKEPSDTRLRGITAAIDAVVPDILNILNGLKFSNPTTLIVVTAVLDGIVTTLDVIASQLPQPPPNPAQLGRIRRLTARPVQKMKVPTPGDLRASWKADVCSKVKNCPAL